MSNKKAHVSGKMHIMGDDAIYVAFVAIISLGLFILGANLSFHG